MNGYQKQEKTGEKTIMITVTKPKQMLVCESRTDAKLVKVTRVAVANCWVWLRWLAPTYCRLLLASASFSNKPS